jgi:hypothetical protein
MIAGLLSSPFSKFPESATGFTIDGDARSQSAVNVLVPWTAVMGDM